MNAPPEVLKKQYGAVVEGPAGLRMPEKVARRIEAAAKDLPKRDEFSYRRRAQTAGEFRTEPKERAEVSVINTDDVDREGDVVLPGGGDWRTYNRVVAWAHDYETLPVGVNLWIKPTETKAAGTGLIAKTRYHTKPPGWTGDWLADAVWHLMQQDPPVCTGKSIGFLPLEVREPTRSELELRPEWKGASIIPKWIGIEYSVAIIPMNPAAEMIAISKAAREPATRDFIARTMDSFVYCSPSTGQCTTIAADQQAAIEALVKVATYERFAERLGAAHAAKRRRATLVELEGLRAGAGVLDKKTAAEIQRTVAGAVDDEIDRMLGRV